MIGSPASALSLEASPYSGYPPEPPCPSFHLLGVRVDDVSADELINVVVGCVVNRKRCIVVNSNAYLINLARSRPWLVRLFDTADLAFCDGAGVQLALWLMTGHRPVRHTPPEWIEALANCLTEHDATVFWLGGRADIVSKAAANLQNRTGIALAGSHHGFFNTATGSAENEAVIARINAARPTLLLINMGMPRQERWLDENWPRLNACIAITAGALVDHVAGRVSRPPRWIADAGFEWLARLLLEPRRLSGRYLLGLPVFALRVMMAALFAPSDATRRAEPGTYAVSSQCPKISTAISSPAVPSPQTAD